MSDLLRVEGSAQQVLDAMREVLALGEMLRPAGRPGGVAEAPAPEMFLEMSDATRHLASEVRGAGEGLLLHVVARKGAPSSDDLEGVADRLDEATDAVLDELGLVRGMPSDSNRRAAVSAAGALLREIGLERLDLDVLPGRGKGVGDVVAVRTIDPRTAHVWLLGRLFERMELVTSADELTALERRASAWWFHRHAEVSDPELEFALGVRENEWSLVERDTLRFGVPVLDVFLETGFGEAAPPRQRKLARALRASFASGFLVKERHGTSAVYEELLRGRRVEVHEHSEDTDYEVGWLGLGRVMPFDGPVHLRSPGMLFMAPGEVSRETIGNTLRKGRRSLPLPFVVEVLLSAFGGARDLPRSLAPAASPREARELARALSDALEEAGLAEEAPVEQADPEALRKAREMGISEIGYRRYDADAAVAEWMKALVEQGRKGGKWRTGRR